MRNPHLARLSFNYLWSNPEAGDDVLVCAALARPKFDDLLMLSHELGLPALHRGWSALEKEGWSSRHIRAIAQWYLEMIENAYRQLAEKNTAAAQVAE